MHIWRGVCVRTRVCVTALSCCCVLSDSSSNVVIERLAVRCYHGAPLFALHLIGHTAHFSHIWGWVKRCGVRSRALCCITDKWHTLTVTWQLKFKHDSWNFTAALQAQTVDFLGLLSNPLSSPTMPSSNVPTLSQQRSFHVARHWRKGQPFLSDLMCLPCIPLEGKNWEI